VSLRLILAGSPAARRRLRAGITGAPVDIVGEFSALAAARRSRVPADGILVAEPAADDDSISAPHEPLTTREREVLEWLAEGMSNKAIAERLAISAQTVKFHVASVIAKLGAGNRTGAVRRAVRNGLLDL